MPHATASWLVDNTALSFEQIAEFCGLHILEIQAIADDTAATKLTGRDPVRAHELTQEEIDRGQADPNYVLQMSKGPEQIRRTKGPRYTPLSKRQDKPDGITWLFCFFFVFFGLLVFLFRVFLTTPPPAGRRTSRNRLNPADDPSTACKSGAQDMLCRRRATRKLASLVAYPRKPPQLSLGRRVSPRSHEGHTVRWIGNAPFRSQSIQKSHPIACAGVHTRARSRVPLAGNRR